MKQIFLHPLLTSASAFSKGVIETLRAEARQHAAVPTIRRRGSGFLDRPAAEIHAGVAVFVLRRSTPPSSSDRRPRLRQYRAAIQIP